MNPITYNGQKVITTTLLAEVYKTDPRQINNNFNRNKSKFEEGKHYFCLEGHELRGFKRDSSERGVAENVNKLYFGLSVVQIATVKSLTLTRHGNSLTIWKRHILK